MRKYIILFFISLCSFLPSFAWSQFASGTSVLGAHIGVSNVARATVLGVKFETCITDWSSGAIGLSGIGDYYSWNGGDFGAQSYLFFTLSASYHLKIDDGSFDPFLGLGISYLSERNTFPPVGGISYYTTDGSGFRPVLSLGARYFLSPNFALRLEFGSSLVYAIGGIDFAF